MRRICLVVGTRPEVIKLAPVADALRATPDFEPLVIATGQHRELLDLAVRGFPSPAEHPSPEVFTPAGKPAAAPSLKRYYRTRELDVV